MILNRKQIEELPDGTILRVFLSGIAWDNDFGKAHDVVKVKDKLYDLTGFYNIEDVDDTGDFQMIVAIKGRI